MLKTEFEDCVQSLRQIGAPFAIATIVRTVDATSAKPGDKAVILETGAIAQGWVGGGCARSAVSRAAKDAMQEGKPRFVSLRPEELLDAEGVQPGDERDGVKFARNGCPSKGSMDIFIEPVIPTPQLIICGSGPVAMALADMGKRFDFNRTLCAPGIIASDAPPVERMIEGFAFETETAAEHFIVIATQGKGDEAALRAAIASGASYIAFVGSRRKYETLRDRLIADGIPADAFAAVKSPAGLDIAAITPDEIALSVLAEIIAKRRARQRPEKGAT
ncbi:XdhC family protein [Actibacterium lipolyticum]|uniref:Putative xanthine dehydrogenase subunit A n=1 Tax=Actibacterium lipolyticum TaxID=1524263 RepID=A0A238JPH4_9RHOB|nr:XdhC/CoxI family protein [Actibacterium lipolyticum]SMX32077.1 putative xanthine dehydrogenase subunit A [Actibacterium lipolyticum]